MENNPTNTNCNVCGSEKGNSSHLLPGSEEEKKVEEEVEPIKSAPDIRFSEIEMIEAEISNQTARRLRKLIHELEELGREKKKKEEKKKKGGKKEEAKQKSPKEQG